MKFIARDYKLIGKEEILELVLKSFQRFWLIIDFPD